MIAPMAPDLRCGLLARSAPEWILAAPSAQSARAFDALLPSMERAIGTAAVWVTAGAPSAISFIEEGLLAVRQYNAGDQRGGDRHKSYESKSHTVLPNVAH
jgi:hypothetical protein